ncbi:MAG: hypothetical protein U9N49_10155 [Campylobacterota bacterium]|nr:hypothetical protein [Campylobacterota bacterium]
MFKRLSQKAKFGVVGTGAVALTTGANAAVPAEFTTGIADASADLTSMGGSITGVMLVLLLIGLAIFLIKRNS